MSIRHFLLTSDGSMEEFSEDEASAVVEGKHDLPRFADRRLRYVQVAYDDAANDEGEIRVRTMGAIVTFDSDGRLREAGSVDDESDELDEFEHDACVQYALRDTMGSTYALN